MLVDPPMESVSLPPVAVDLPKESVVLSVAVGLPEESVVPLQVAVGLPMESVVPPQVEVGLPMESVFRLVLVSQQTEPLSAVCPPGDWVASLVLVSPWWEWGVLP